MNLWSVEHVLNISWPFLSSHLSKANPPKSDNNHFGKMHLWPVEHSSHHKRGPVLSPPSPPLATGLCSTTYFKLRSQTKPWLGLRWGSTLLASGGLEVGPRRFMKGQDPIRAIFLLSLIGVANQEAKFSRELQHNSMFECCSAKYESYETDCFATSYKSALRVWLF